MTPTVSGTIFQRVILRLFDLAPGELVSLPETMGGAVTPLFVGGRIPTVWELRVIYPFGTLPLYERVHAQISLPGRLAVAD